MFACSLVIGWLMATGPLASPLSSFWFSCWPLLQRSTKTPHYSLKLLPVCNQVHHQEFSQNPQRKSRTPPRRSPPKKVSPMFQHDPNPCSISVHTPKEWTLGSTFCCCDSWPRADERAKQGFDMLGAFSKSCDKDHCLSRVWIWEKVLFLVTPSI